MTKFIAGLSRGELREQVGDVPRMAAVPSPFGQEEGRQVTAGQGGRSGKNSGRLNLRAVADVLETYGLDPIEEVAKTLVKTKPLVDRDGKPVIDPETGEIIQVPVLDGDTRLRTLLELAQYSRPKLKAVEVTNKTPELTEEQVEARLKALLERQAKGH
jgi:hypothetical protein